MSKPVVIKITGFYAKYVITINLGLHILLCFNWRIWMLKNPCSTNPAYYSSTYYCSKGSQFNKKYDFAVLWFQYYHQKVKNRWYVFYNNNMIPHSECHQPFLLLELPTAVAKLSVLFQSISIHSSKQCITFA